MTSRIWLEYLIVDLLESCATPPANTVTDEKIGDMACKKFQHTGKLTNSGASYIDGQRSGYIAGVKEALSKPPERDGGISVEDRLQEKRKKWVAERQIKVSTN